MCILSPPLHHFMEVGASGKGSHSSLHKACESHSNWLTLESKGTQEICGGIPNGVRVLRRHRAQIVKLLQVVWRAFLGPFLYQPFSIVSWSTLMRFHFPLWSPIPPYPRRKHTPQKETYIHTQRMQGECITFISGHDLQFCLHHLGWTNREGGLKSRLPLIS